MLDDYPAQRADRLPVLAGHQVLALLQSCNVLKAEPDTLRDSRLLLCDLTGRTIELGLSLLGIGVVDKM